MTGLSHGDDTGPLPRGEGVSASLSAEDAAALLVVLQDGEGWLMQRILELAGERDYTRYTSTLLEAWRLSIVGLTETVEVALRLSPEVPELGPDLDPATDPLGAFGVQEATRHRERGINLAMFLGLFKYYRQCYRELLDEAAATGRFRAPSVVQTYVDRVFDRTEIAYTSSWAGTSAEQQIRDLSESNRDATNEKNRLLTLIESLSVPTLLVDEDGRVDLMNRQAALLLTGQSGSGQTHYGDQPEVGRPAWLSELVASLGDQQSLEAEVPLLVDGQPRLYLAHISHLEDVSHKYIGYAVALLDVTQDRLQRRELLTASEVFTSTRDGVIIVDPGGRITTANPAFGALLGFDSRELVGLPIEDLLESLDDGGAGSVMQAVEDRGEWMGEVRLIGRDQRFITGWLSMSRVDGGGTPDGQTIGIFTDITPLKDTERELAHLAHHDPLTGLVNRAELRTLLDSMIAAAGHRRERIGVLFLDLDRFKEINDTLGHEVGDGVLRAVAERLRGAMRGHDLLGRLGGDEFMIVAENLTRAEQADLVAERALRSLDAPITVGGQDHAITASVGISIFPDDGQSVDDLVRNADSAMYLAKAQGRSTFRRYVPSLTEDAQRRLMMRNALRRDVEANALQVHYQPIVSLRDGRITGLEALLRWTPDELGEVPPAVFVPMLEDLGLIRGVGAWVLDRSIQQLAEWALSRVPVPLVAVNVAPSQIEDAGFSEAVRDRLADRGVDPHRLQLEVTEGTVFRMRSRGAEVLRSLSRTGVTVAIDDFGTGYSSLGRLRDLPISVLKIDRTFVANLAPESGRGGEAMVSAIVALAHALQLTVTAEGVETDDVAAILRGVGCDRAQGYGYSAALPPESVPDFISGRVAV